MSTEAASTIRIADGVWIATALHHKEKPERLDFTESEIKARFLAEGLPRGLNTNSLPTNISSHCVANKPRSRKRSDPSKMQGGPYRMIFETRPGYRRLFCPDDYVHPDRIQPRAPSKAIPKREEIPTKYGPLLEWYETWSKEAYA